MSFKNFWNKYPEGMTLPEQFVNLLGYTREVDGNLKNKTDKYGNHEGSWQGLNKPTMSEEGMRATVEKINEVDLPLLSFNISSIKNWDDDILKALTETDYIYIPKDTTITLNSTITKNLINGKRIRGEGATSVLKVVGNITAIDLSECSNSELTDFTIEVDTNNASEIIRLGTPNNTGQTLKNKVSNLTIRCNNEEQGTYQGIVLYSDGQGVWNNELENIKIIRPQNGVLLHAEKKTDKPTAWLTDNTIRNVYVRGMLNNGFETRQTTISETGNGETQLSQNFFSDITIQDIAMTDITRKAFVVGGSADVYQGLRSFADSGYGTFVALEFSKPKGSFLGQNYIIGGMLEGLIVNEEYKNMNVVDFYSFSVKNSIDSKPKKIRFTNNYNNVLRNSNFRENINYWSQTGADLINVVADTSATYGRCLSLTRSTNGNITVYQNVPNRSAYANKKASYIVCLKVVNSPTVTIMIDEGTPGNTSNTFATTGEYQVIMIDREIKGTGEALNCQISVSGTNVDVKVAWAVLSTNGYCRNENYIYETGGMGLFSNNGSATIPIGSTSVVVNHGLSTITPLNSKIQITPTNNLGNATKYWISNVTNNTFTINIDVNPTISGATFAWNIEE